MLRQALLRALVLVSIASSTTATAGAEVDPAMNRLEALGGALRANPVWSADYQQEYVPVGMTTGETIVGRVWLAWPDRALFHTGSPPVRLMGLEGRVARLVDLEAGSCDEHRLSDREWQRVPLVAVLDPRASVAHFSVLELGDRGFMLVPREPGGIDRVEVVLGDDGLPAEVLVVDPQGAVNRLRFSGWHPSVQPPDGAWLPLPPPDVECVSDPGALDG